MIHGFHGTHRLRELGLGTIEKQKFDLVNENQMIQLPLSLVTSNSSIASYTVMIALVKLVSKLATMQCCMDPISDGNFRLVRKNSLTFKSAQELRDHGLVVAYLTSSCTCLIKFIILLHNTSFNAHHTSTKWQRA